MASDSSEAYLLLNRLGEEFADRFRRGERPSLQEYIDRHPELADEIREFFPAMVDLERVKEEREVVTGPVAVGPLPTLERLGDYRIIREIGRGGMGVVYEAEQVSLGRHVALKVLPRQLLMDARTKQRFEREARSAARLHHTNIVPVFGVGEHDGLPYYVMQFIQGLGLDQVIEELERLRPQVGGPRSSPRPSGELRVSPRETSAAMVHRAHTAAEMARSLLTGRFHLLDEGEATIADPAADGETDAAPAPAVVKAASPPSPIPGRLSDSFSVSSSSVVLPSGSRTGKGRASYWQSVARIGVQVADALQHAHDQGVLHRDIKPSNLLLDTAGVVWVTDFGLAKADDQKNLTNTGDILGTLRYMPPEAFDGRTDARADVYSLGLTLYEMLAMRPAFDEKDRNHLIKRVTTGEPERLERINAGVPADLVTVVHKAIERDPSHRYPTAGELMADLQRFLDDEPIRARRQTSMERLGRWARRNKGIARLLGVLAAVAVVVTVASVFVAAHMITLARQEKRSAREERLARDAAQQASLREAGERERAEAALKSAEASRAQAVDALRKAEEGFARARAAVTDYLTAVSDDPHLKAPGLSPLRARLLQSALGFYQQFLRERGDDPMLRKELASVYFKVGIIFRELGQYQASQQSFTESGRLYEALVALAPTDPELQFGLASARFWVGDYNRTIAILEGLRSRDDPRYQKLLGDAYSIVVAVPGRTDRAKQAEFLRKALLIRERLVQLRPDDPEARTGLSSSLHHLADALNDDRLVEKRVLLRRAVEQSEAACRLRADADSQVALAAQLRRLAVLAELAGDTEEQLTALHRWVEVLDRLARGNAGNSTTDMMLVDGYTALVAALVRAGRLDEAMKVADRARERSAETSNETSIFIGLVSALSLRVHQAALERARAAPNGAASAEREAAAAVADLRQRVLAGWRDAHWMRTNPLTAPLRERADFQELLARLDELVSAGAIARKADAPAQEKLAARQKALAALESLARPLPPARFIRRSLAQARHALARALLDAGRIEQARAAFDEALAERQALVAESPTDRSLRIELVQIQISTGDLLAAAGQLGEGSAAWEKGLAALEAGLAEDPNSFPMRVALSEALTQVGINYHWLGRWEETLRCYRRAFEVNTPTRFVHWLPYALAMAEAGDARGVDDLIRQALALRPNADLEDEVSYARLVLLAPCDDPRWPRVVRGLADNPRTLAWEQWDQWIRAFARVRLGEVKEGLDRLAGIPDPFWKWPSVALAEHRLGHLEAARQALRQADLDAEHYTPVADPSRPLLGPQQDWFHFRELRRQAHQTIDGGPLPDSPTERMFRGRVFHALGRTAAADAEFAAAVRIRPDDADVWLARARTFAALGRKDRAAADQLRAQELKGGDARTWIETGRMLAELGDHRQADTAFARASETGGGELDRFLEAGWWVVGPYPEQIDVPCPPEVDPDPSRPVAAGRGDYTLRWKAVSTAVHTGAIDIKTIAGEQKNVSYYALAYVHAAQDRTASLVLSAGDETRVWVNGRLAFAGYIPWKIPAGAEVRIPVTLKAGRNAILLRIRQSQQPTWCHCQFEDSPLVQAQDLAKLGMWAEAASAFAEADRRSDLSPSWWMIYAALGSFAAGREADGRATLATMIRRHDRPGSEGIQAEAAVACLLAQGAPADRDRWIVPVRQWTEWYPNNPFLLHRLAYAEFLAGRYREAEAHSRQVIAIRDLLPFWPLRAATLHRTGKQDEARKVLQEIERRRAGQVKQALASARYQPALHWDDPAESLDALWKQELWYKVTLRDARRLILGTDPGPGADEIALQEKGRRWRAQLDVAEDDYARLVLSYPDQPRLWIDRGRRLGELGRWNEVAGVFAKANELASGNPQVNQECGRVYAELGRWDEAAAELTKALVLTPESTLEFPYNPWQYGRGDVDDVIARSDQVYTRVARQRAKDRVLSARRAEFLAEAGRWADAEAALRDHVNRFADDWWAPALLAKRLLLEGKLDDYKRVCQQALDRFSGRNEYYLPLNVGRTALLAGAGFEDHALIRKIVDDAERQQVPEFWMQSTAALAELRRGDAAAAIRRLDARVFAYPDFPNSQAMADAIRALACQKAGRTDQAEAALERVRAALEMHRQRPDLGARAYDWHNWTQVEILAREAEGLIPSAPAPTSAAPMSLARDQAARRDRRARADQLSSRTALALLAQDAGRFQQALAELKEVLAERIRIAAEEPSNSEYLADLAATYAQVGRLMLGGSEGVEIIPTAATKPVLWRYTTEKPADEWTQPEFDDSRWKEGLAGFGTAGTPGAVIGTTWTTQDIWIRRAAELPSSIHPSGLRLQIYHDDGVELFVNGVPAMTRRGWITTYESIDVPSERLARIKKGPRIVVAAHCHQDGQGQGVDVGLTLMAIGVSDGEAYITELQHAAEVMEKIDPADAQRRGVHLDVLGSFVDCAEELRKVNRPEAAARLLGSAAHIAARQIAIDPKGSAVTWLVLAISQGLRGEIGPGRKSCEKAAELIKSAPGRTALSRLVRKAAWATGLDGPETVTLLAAAAGQPQAVRGEAGDPEAKHAIEFFERGEWYGKHWLLGRAAADFDEADRLAPSSVNSLEHAIALVRLGQMDRYRAVCKAMLDRWGQSRDIADAERTIKTCLLHPDSRIEPKQLTGPLRVVSSGHPRQQWMEWFPFARGIHAYRSGDFAAAVAECRESRRRSDDLPNGGYPPLSAADLAVEAMALFRQGDAAPAREAVSQSRRLIDGWVSDANHDVWHDWIMADILCREAEALIAHPKAATR